MDCSPHAMATSFTLILWTDLSALIDQLVFDLKDSSSLLEMV